MALSTSFTLLSCDAALLSRAVRVPGARAVGLVRPLSLDLPLNAIAEGDQWHIERPGALVTVLRAR